MSYLLYIPRFGDLTFLLDPSINTKKILVGFVGLWSCHKSEKNSKQKLSHPLMAIPWDLFLFFLVGFFYLWRSKLSSSPAAGHSLLPCSWTFEAVDWGLSHCLWWRCFQLTAQAFPSLFIALSAIRILCCVCNHVVCAWRIRFRYDYRWNQIHLIYFSSIITIMS